MPGRVFGRPETKEAALDEPSRVRPAKSVKQDRTSRSTRPIEGLTAGGPYGVGFEGAVWQAVPPINGSDTCYDVFGQGGSQSANTADMVGIWAWAPNQQGACVGG